jgi:ABC-type multidrug transport system permease subunit
MRIINFIVTELRVLFSSKATLAWFFLLPLIFSLFFGLLFEDSSQKAQVALGVVNSDEGFLSHRLIEALSSEGFSIEELSHDSFEEAEEVPRALFIPADFTDRAISGERVKVLLKKHEDANVKASKAAEANIFKAIIRVIGNLSLMELEGAVTESTSVEEAYDSTVPKEPRVGLDIELAGRHRILPSGFNSSVPGNVVMFVLLCVLIYSVQLLIAEKKGGLLHRISVGPVTAWQIIAGKLCSRAMAGVIQIIFLFTASAILFDVYFGSSWAGLLSLMAAYVLCVAGLALLVGAVVDSPEFASGLSVLLSLVMAALGGCWWPLEIVPSPVHELAFIFPTGWAMDGLHKVMAFGYGFRAVITNVLILLGMFILFSSFAVRLMKKELTTAR